MSHLLSSQRLRVQYGIVLLENTYKLLLSGWGFYYIVWKLFAQNLKLVHCRADVFGEFLATAKVYKLHILKIQFVLFSLRINFTKVANKTSATCVNLTVFNVFLIFNCQNPKNVSCKTEYFLFFSEFLVSSDLKFKKLKIPALLVVSNEIFG